MEKERGNTTYSTASRWISSTVSVARLPVKISMGTHPVEGEQEGIKSKSS